MFIQHSYNTERLFSHVEKICCFCIPLHRIVVKDKITYTSNFVSRLTLQTSTICLFILY